MNNLKYSILLDTKSGLLPELKIVKKELDNVSTSAKKSLSFIDRLKDIKLAALISNVKSLSKSLSGLTAPSVDFEQGMAEQMKRIQANIDDVKISLFEATKGISGYVSALGETAVTPMVNHRQRSAPSPEIVPVFPPPPRSAYNPNRKVSPLRKNNRCPSALRWAVSSGPWK